VRSQLHLDAATERWVLSDLNGYFEEKLVELQGAGLSEAEARTSAIEACGPPKLIARYMYEAHSKGSWAQAAAASLPHFILAFLFAFHLWKHPFWLPVALGAIIYVTLFGWRRNKPNWMFSWGGYFLLLLIILGYTAEPILHQAVSILIWPGRVFPGALVFLMNTTLLMFLGWLAIRVIIRVIQRDWILASMALVPLPILGIWLVELDRAGGLLSSNIKELHQSDMLMATVLAILALASALFIRLRQRMVKFGVLAMTGSIMLIIVAQDLWDIHSIFGSLLMCLLMVLLLLIPALLSTRIEHGEHVDEIWDEQTREKLPHF